MLFIRFNKDGRLNYYNYLVKGDRSVRPVVVLQHLLPSVVKKELISAKAAPVMPPVEGGEACHYHYGGLKLVVHVGFVGPEVVAR